MSEEQSDDVARLQARLERERRARRQAEVIAERGMRELWETNRQLQERVARRTAELERLVGGLEFANAARLRAISELTVDLIVDVEASRELGGPQTDHLVPVLDQVRLLAQGSRSADELIADECAPIEVIDRLVERWQRPAARRGQLLTAEVGRTDDDVVFHWPRLMAVADTVIGGCVRHAGSGLLSVVLSVTATDVELDVHCAGLAVPAEVAPVGVVPTDCVRDIGPVGADLELADRIARSGAGWSTVRRREDGTLGVLVTLPRPE